jgi:hypothetical protein
MDHQKLNAMLDKVAIYHEPKVCPLTLDYCSPDLLFYFLSSTNYFIANCEQL